MVVGDQPSTSLTSETIVRALVGEQMKCRVWGRPSTVPSRSRGVNLTRGVRYLNLIILAEIANQQIRTSRIEKGRFTNPL